MSSLQLYLLITVLPALKALFLILAIILFIIGSVIIIEDGNFSSNKTDAKWGLFCILLSFIFGMSSCFVPTKKDIAIIYTASYLTNNEKAEMLPNRVLDLIHSYIDKGFEDSMLVDTE